MHFLGYFWYCLFTFLFPFPRHSFAKSWSSLHILFPYFYCFCFRWQWMFLNNPVTWHLASTEAAWCCFPGVLRCLVSLFSVPIQSLSSMSFSRIACCKMRRPCNCSRWWLQMRQTVSSQAWLQELTPLPWGWSTCRRNRSSRSCKRLPHSVIIVIKMHASGSISWPCTR